MGGRRPTFRQTQTERQTDALVLRVVPYGEADAIVTMFTGAMGRVSAIARGARAAATSKRAAPAVEPMHTLRIRLAERENVELVTLKASTIETARLHLIASLPKLEAAGRALRWVRRVVPPRVPEAELWTVLIALLDAWNAPTDALAIDARLAGFGLRSLAILGWGLELDRCVRCSKECPSGKAARLDPAAGGVRCTTCGGGPHVLTGDLRERMLAATAGGDIVFDASEASRVLKFLDEAFDAHAT